MFFQGFYTNLYKNLGPWGRIFIRGPIFFSGGAVRVPPALYSVSRMVEYLLTRVRADRQKPDFENYAFEHVLSYQRRVKATKENFMKRNNLTPLGIVTDWWEA